MNYTKHTWVTGEKITAPLLNRIEEGIKEMADTAFTEATDAECDALFIDFLDTN